ncbi:MAG TPA: phosphoenolpyruvate--protein phosphotransferase, partial [Spirochaeta sp.]|nr:phosphoenolpyruvate--protein phosphotransferase [Spirochaeta sp.]
MKKLSGLSASQGIAIGKVFFNLDEYLRVPEYRIKEDEVEAEIGRLDIAVGKTREELIELKNSIINENNIKEAGFLDAHILMLEDPELSKQIKSRIIDSYYNAEWALYETVKGFVELIEASNDEYIKERTFDIRDVAKRVLGNLLYKKRIDLKDLNEEVILIAHELLPSDTLTMDKRMVKGIATDAGGRTSHTAILARAFEIPAVLGLKNITAEVRIGEQIIIDGSRGIVIIRPDEETLEKYRKKLYDWQKKEVELLNLNMLPAETKDGKKILLKANIEIPEETESVLSHGADGVGLYRSEFFFLQPGKLASEEEQYEAYSQVLSSMGNKPVTIRTIDLGGDKML